MKKRLIGVITLGIMIFSLSSCSGCGKGSAATELPLEGIRSMIATEAGDMYLLTDKGLIRYALSSDKKRETIYDSADLQNAKFEWIDRGQDITYSDIYIDRLMSLGEDGVNMVAKYTNNNGGRTTELFVLQDAFDLNYSAGHFTEIEKEGEGSFLNGAAATSSGVFYKLNRRDIDGDKYDNGSFFSFTGSVEPFDMPDDVTGAVRAKDNDTIRTIFLVENSGKAQLVENGEVIKDFDRSQVADVFVDDGSFYVIYKNGKVTKADALGKESGYTNLKCKVSDVNDALIYDGKIYWYDKTGVRTGKN